MEFITDVASQDANSYATVDEADAYLTDRDGFDTAGWNALTEAQKQLRLVFAAMIIDSLTYRGVKATKLQNLKFPMLFSGNSFGTWKILKEFQCLLRIGIRL